MFGHGGANRGITTPGSTTSGRISARYVVVGNQISGFQREAIGFSGTHGLYANNNITLDVDAVATGLYAIQVGPSGTTAITDNIFRGNIITDKTGSPTYDWGGIISGRADGTVAQYNLIEGNVLNSLQGTPIKANHSTIKVYRNTRMRTSVSNDLTSATVADND